MKKKTIERIIRNYHFGKDTYIGKYKYCLKVTYIYIGGKQMVGQVKILRKHRDAVAGGTWFTYKTLENYLYSVLYKLDEPFDYSWAYTGKTFLSDEEAENWILENGHEGFKYDIFDEEYDDLRYFIEEGGELK